MTETNADRNYWLSVLERLARPVLTALSEHRLKRDMPVESSGSTAHLYSHLEAIGRLLAGIAPWIACEALTGDEAALRDELQSLALRGLRNAVDPASPDRIDFAAGHHVVVHTAFLAQSFPTWEGIFPVCQSSLSPTWLAPPAW